MFFGYMFILCSLVGCGRGICIDVCSLVDLVCDEVERL